MAAEAMLLAEEHGMTAGCPGVVRKWRVEE
jgi:hypothetical protein